MLSVAALITALMLVQQPVVIENRSGARRPVAGAGTGEARMVRTCRDERVTGSNLPRRVCRNRAVTAQARNDSQDGLRRIQGSRMPDILQ